MFLVMNTLFWLSQPPRKLWFIVSTYLPLKNFPGACDHQEILGFLMNRGILGHSVLVSKEFLLILYSQVIPVVQCRTKILWNILKYDLMMYYHLLPPTCGMIMINIFYALLTAWFTSSF